MRASSSRASKTETRVGILGLAYKPDTGVIEESPGLALARAPRRDGGHEVNVYDPVATEAAVRVAGRAAHGCASVEELLERSDVVVIATPWPEFADLPVEALAGGRTAPVVIDCWRLLPERALRRSGRDRAARSAARGAEPRLTTEEEAMTMNDTSTEDDPILVAGAGGFIGGWLVRYLQENGFTNLRAIDIKPLDEWYQVLPGVDNRVADLRSLETCREAVHGVAHVYNLACDMGGMGFIEANKAACMISVLINTHLLMAARDDGVKRHLLRLVGVHLQHRSSSRTPR